MWALLRQRLGKELDWLWLSFSLRYKMMATNIILTENAAFGNTNYDVVRALIYMVDNNMMEAIGQPYFSTKQCLVVPTEDVPMCVKAGEQHIIFLATKDNLWCQWVYQFSHEYCHHLIDGSLSGEWSDLLWFEETLCELSSLYNLNKMISYCANNGLQRYVPSVKSYLENLLTKNNDKYKLSAGGGWYKQYEASLKKEEYKRDLYNAIAVLMYPLFIDTPNLWKLILIIGDIRSWTSLDELFNHLEINSDGSYSESLGKMRKMFG